MSHKRISYKEITTGFNFKCILIRKYFLIVGSLKNKSAKITIISWYGYGVFK